MKTSKIRLVLAVIFLYVMFVFTTAASAATGDNILSGNIKEADGTSGQDTNTGAGIKSGHIQQNAITTDKIAAGAVTATKLGIVCPDGQYLQFSVVNGWICSVGTPGPIGPQGTTGEAGPQGPIGLTGLQGPAGPTYAGTKIVHKGMADGVNTFNTITDALNAITDNSTTNRYVVNVMPGLYEESITGKSYVDIVGASRTGSIISGVGETTIAAVDHMFIRNLTIQNGWYGVFFSQSYSGISDCDLIGQMDGVVINADHTSVKNVSYTTSGLSGVGISLGDGINVTGVSTIVIRDIDIRSDNAYGITVQTDPSEVLNISDVNIHNSSGTGIAINSGRVQIDHANIYASVAVIGWGTATCNSCTITGVADAVRFATFDANNSTVDGRIYNIYGAAVHFANTKFTGTLSGTGVKTINCFDGDYNTITDGVH